ncbi:MAG: protein-L-isoaspartate(D-aspartate) O-methyltransferase [Candidatus Hydrogenedentota bacterium]|nr:MAG: protein-L-isoaspartate(D-aspartate) O-methyltransferase [Candidatus Hydrogenedentota bacterium]
MIQYHLKARGIKNPHVLDAMRKVDRHLFVPPEYQKEAYYDGPIPIGFGQTISQPYIVAYMTEMLNPQPEDKVLEIGCGSGYQAAVFAEIVKEVYTIEIIKPLYERAQKTLQKLGYKNIYCKLGDGYEGWPEKAPFDIILFAAAPKERIPEPVISQLAKGGRLIAPVGEIYQQLVLITKDKTGSLHTKPLIPVRFVPLTGKGG